MKLFRIYVDGSLFYHPHLSKLAITQAQVSEDAESIDSMVLSAPFNHPYLNRIRPLSSTIVCRLGQDIVFEGRALDDGSDFYNSHTWTCESCLAYLKDTLQKPYDYQGSLRGLLEYFVEEHNKTVEPKKQFTVGQVTVKDENDYIHYSNSDYSVTLTAIKEKLIDTHGGYLRVRYDGDRKILDFLSKFPETSGQQVEYGKNLLDVKISRDHTQRITALIPYGAKKTVEDEEGNITELEERIGIETVNHGLNYVCDEDAIKEVGWIWTSEVWEDVTTEGALLKKAQSRVKELSSGVTSMELTIVDEADTGADIDDIRARMYVDCISRPHGIDGRYLVLSRNRDYLHPAGNTITIGASGVKLTAATARQDKSLTALEDSLFGYTSTVEKITGDIEELRDSVTTLLRIDSSRGTVFKNDSLSTVLSVVIYRGGQEIRDPAALRAAMGSSAYLQWSWQRLDEESYGIISSADSRIGNGGFSFTLSPEDVDTKVTFKCELID